MPGGGGVGQARSDGAGAEQGGREGPKRDASQHRGREDGACSGKEGVQEPARRAGGGRRMRERFRDARHLREG